MFGNIDQVHDRFLQYAIFKVVVGRILSIDLIDRESNCSLQSKAKGEFVYKDKQWKKFNL